MASISWNGGQIKKRVAAAAALGVDRTMADCVADAREGHPAYPPASEPGERYANRTGFNTASIDIHEPATMEDGKVVGRWGSDSEIALYLEIGTSREDSGEPRAEVREAMGGDDFDAIPPPSEPPLMAPRPTLHPAADQNYGRLKGYIGRAFQGENL